MSYAHPSLQGGDARGRISPFTTSSSVTQHDLYTQSPCQPPPVTMPQIHVDPPPLSITLVEQQQTSSVSVDGGANSNMVSHPHPHALPPASAHIDQSLMQWPPPIYSSDSAPWASSHFLPRWRSEHRPGRITSDEQWSKTPQCGEHGQQNLREENFSSGKTYAQWYHHYQEQQKDHERYEREPNDRELKYWHRGLRDSESGSRYGDCECFF